MFSPWHLAVCLLIGVHLPSIIDSSNSCKKNRFIDYNQMVETSCLIETCVVASNCSLSPLCPCKRDFVVRYNVTIDHDDDDDHDDDEFSSHLGVITQSAVDEGQVILIGHFYPCFYDERDISTIFWTRPDRTTYYILLTLSLIIVLAIILVPIVYLMLIIEFTHAESEKLKKET